MFGSSPISKGIPLDFSGTATPMDSKFSIRELLQSLPKKLNGSSGSDGITGRMLRCLTLVNLKKILSLVNNIWLSGNIPPSWKHSVIIPILKPGKNASELKSHRPISLTSVLCKTERMICRRLTDFFLKENIFHPHHFGFLPFRSCESLQMMFFNILLKAHSNKEYIIAASLDISSAYDSVWPDGVVYKALQIGLSGHTARWIHEFLTNRTLQVLWSGKLSASFTSNRGVPQGCCISPYLFTIYLHDVFEIIPPGVTCLIHADDICIICSDPSLQNVNTKLQITIQKIQIWCQTWKLKLDPTKSTVVNFSNKRQTPNFQISVDNVYIPWSNNMKVLGIFFSANLSFNCHFNYVAKKALKRLGYLRALGGSNWGANTVHLLSFLLRHFALGDNFSPIKKSNLCTLDGLRPSFKERFSGGTNWLNFLKDANVSIENFIPFVYPVELQQENTISIHTNDLPFQQSQIPYPTLCKLFDEYVNKEWNSSILIATDASKGEEGVSLAALNITYNRTLTLKLHPMNSVFTAEGCAILIAIERFIQEEDKSYILCSDSLSVLKSLESLHRKWPTISLQIGSAIIRAIPRSKAIKLVWVPAHVGITINEQADEAARAARISDVNIYPCISTEDLRKVIFRVQADQGRIQWESTKYFRSFTHLPKITKIQLLPRRKEILLTRLRTRSLPTKAILFKVGLESSPLCRQCGIVDSNDHLLLTCIVFEQLRNTLRPSLGIGALHYNWICTISTLNRRACSAVLLFLQSTNLF
ncbi:putative RNA-directed DNA polymerase from transposon BS [Araneus ventricosus]|uniref:Putative RNA-directed DNA polymerase from transposon BS n=1 Tax=Araneus ventricosus TaxID=182803 RepID=A0A4Y2JAN4_ARAVE|nr:putative RNA-directed DNA polymerase from transposon BS [Araneus ventricosus]